MQAAETIVVPLSEPIRGTSDTHIVIPKGSILEIPVNIIQTDPDIWGSDAETFRPERWLERKRQGISHEREILAFSEGYVVSTPFAIKKAHPVARTRQPPLMHWKSFCFVRS